MSYNFLGNETGYSDGAYSRSTAYDSTDRLNGFNVNNQSLLSNPQYYPYGLKQVTLGNGLTENRNYDPNRLWLTSLQVGSTGNPTSAYSLGLGYYTNGNINTANDSVNGNWTYGYDYLNRLQVAQLNGQSFNYYPDRYGNMYCTAPTGTNYSCTPPHGAQLNQHMNFNSANQIWDDGDGVYQYDGAGNLLQDGTHGYAYDLENRITCVQGTDGTCTSYNATQYLYDADGQRVGKQQANTLEDYVYDPQGHITSVYQNGSATPFRAELYTPQGRHVATWNPSTPCNGTLFFNHADWLGTERVRTTSTGSFCQSFTDTPYGMNLADNPSADTSPTHFTGKQRDYESGLDNFGARYFGGGNNLGRFMTPDVFYKDSHVADPQSWNEYAYARNNPLRYVDPNGEMATVTTNCSTTDNQTTCNVNVSASIEIYAAPGSGITNDQLTQAATAMQNSIDKAWTGSFTQDGVTYNVSTQVTVSVADSKDAAMSSGAQNVYGMTNGPPRHGEDAHTNPRSPLGGPDTGEIDIKNAGGDSAHEFTHLLGVNDHTGTVLSNTYGPDQPRDLKATAQDFQWGIKEVTTGVSSMKNAGNLPSSYHNQSTIRAPRFWWNWK